MVLQELTITLGLKLDTILNLDLFPEDPSPTSFLLLRSWGLLPFKPQTLGQPSGALRIAWH